MIQQHSIGLEPIDWPTALSRAKRRLGRLLRTKQTVAMEDVLRTIQTAEDIDRRRFGALIARMHRDGKIVRVGYRESLNRHHHAGTKALWRLAPSVKKPIMRDGQPHSEVFESHRTRPMIARTEPKWVRARRIKLLRQLLDCCDPHEREIVMQQLRRLSA